MTGKNNIFSADDNVAPQVSIKDLNEERLRHLSERISTSDPKSPAKPFAAYAAAAAPTEATEPTQKKFSESWMKMQTFIKQRSAELLRWR